MATEPTVAVLQGQLRVSERRLELCKQGRDRLAVLAAGLHERAARCTCGAFDEAPTEQMIQRATTFQDARLLRAIREVGDE